MILVEGCDGTGKTTLVNSLVQDLGLRVGQRGTVNRDELYKYTRQDTYRALSLAVGGNVTYYPGPLIWDRLGPISDPIYSRIMGRECAFKRSEIEFFRRLAEAVRFPIVICHVPLEVGEENQARTHQMDGVDANYPFVHGLYEGVRDHLLTWSPPCHVYDYRVPNAYEELKAQIYNYIVNRRDREWH
jgi:hypothetical protein